LILSFITLTPPLLRGQGNSFKEAKMTDKISRRHLFTKEILRVLGRIHKDIYLPAEDRRKDGIEAYFKSPLSSYPLLQEMPWDMLIFAAKSRDIPTEGRSKNDIARDLFMKISNNI